MASTHPDIPVLDLAGTPGQLGAAHGEAQRERIREYADRFIGWMASTAAVRVSEVELWSRWAPQVAVNQRETPDLIEEMRGIARGAGVPFERIFLLNSLLDLSSFRYLGVDASPEMVEAGRRNGRDLALGDLNDYVPTEPVAATTIFRAIYYARDRAAFFRHVAGYTQRKLVFDLNPRQYRLVEVRRDLTEAGFSGLELRPFFAPQRVALPAPASASLYALERSGPLARLLLRFRFSYVCAAFRGDKNS